MNAEYRTELSRRPGPAGDGPWMMLWPLSTAVGVWGTALVYRGLGSGHGLWLGITLLVGGWLLTGRWLGQARRLYRTAQEGTRGVAPAGTGGSPRRERR